MKKKPLEPWLLITGDHHVGSTTGLAPATEVRTEDQRWLLSCWQDVIKRAKVEAAGKAFVLLLGGDHVDGPRHHDTWETWGTPKQQRDAAITLLQPLANIASDVRSILGTEAHAGPLGDDDRTVGEEMGAKTAKYLWRFMVGGKRIFWTHHGVSVSRDPWNEANSSFAMARRLSVRALQGGVPSPDYAIFHHSHFSPPPVTAYGITVAVCPAFQCATSYGFRRGPEKNPDIGVLALWPAQGRLERWTYTRKDDYEEIKA